MKSITILDASGSLLTDDLNQLVRLKLPSARVL